MSYQSADAPTAAALPAYLQADPAALATEEGRAWEAERLRRLRLEYGLGRDEQMDQLRLLLPDLAAAEFADWEQAGALDAVELDGRRRYSRLNRYNVWRLSEAARTRLAEAVQSGRVAEARLPGADRPLAQAALRAHARDLMAAARQTGERYLLPHTYTIAYSLTVRPDQVPPGELIRCWLLYPRGCDTQRDVELLSAEPGPGLIAPDAEACQRTIYLEQPAAAAGLPTVFHVRYRYTALGSYVPVDPRRVESPDLGDPQVREALAPRPPHLALTPELRQLAGEIVGEEGNPYLRARLVFGWIQEHVTYTTALEYSTIPNLSAYCMATRQGDCGIQAMLFIALCRAAGVPARWQSGWYVQPENGGMHDWARFYVAPYGWLHADPSKGWLKVPEGETPETLQWFLFGNQDAFRLVANDDYGRALWPPKRHPRSEPVDFQRGEVEWRGGNLYFGQWGWSMLVE